MPLEIAEHRGRADEQDPCADDLGKLSVERVLENVSAGSVGRGRLVAQCEQEIEIGYPGHGRASRDAPVEICTMQAVPALAGRRCREATGRVDDGRKRRWHACKGTLTLDEPVLVKPYRAHARTLPRAPGDRPVVSGTYGDPCGRS